MNLFSINFTGMPLFVQKPDGSLSHYVYGQVLNPGETIIPINDNRRRGARQPFRGRGRGWQPRERSQSRGRFPQQDFRGQRSRSRSASRRRRLQRLEGTGGNYRGEVPCSVDGYHSGAVNNRHPHNHDDDNVLETRPGDYVIPSRARFSAINHEDIGGGIHKHIYSFEYYTRHINKEERKARVNFNGRVNGLTEQLDQVQI